MNGGDKMVKEEVIRKRDNIVVEHYTRYTGHKKTGTARGTSKGRGKKKK